MRLELSRAHQRFLGLTGEERPQQDEEAVSIGRVEVTPHACASLRTQLHVPGRYRGGPLLGYRWNGVIVVLHATSRGYTLWREQDDSPLDLDGHYLLGWLDCLRVQVDTPSPIDWVGNWLSYPDSLLGNRLDEDVEWINQASSTRLIDDKHCLLVVGWEDGELAAHAYTALEGGNVVTLYHNLAGFQPQT